jgi:ABC-type glutathione transport system ATPase component
VVGNHLSGAGNSGNRSGVQLHRRRIAKRIRSKARPIMMLEVRDLQISYRDQVVSSVPTLDLEPGQVLGIAGESGSGKSQTALALMGLTRYANGVVTGSMMLDGRELLSLSARQWRLVRGRDIAMILQSPRAALNPTMKLGALFSRTLRLHGMTKDQRGPRMVQALAEVVLDAEILDRYPHEISGGQAQRFAIALVAALRVKVLIADEPTSALDVTVQAEVIDVLRNLRDRHGTAIIFISHDLSVIGELADTVMVMRDGTVVEQGSADAIFNQPTQEYTRMLLAAIPVIGGRSR